MKLLKQGELSETVRKNKYILLYFSNGTHKCRLADILVTESEKAIDGGIAFFKADLTVGNFAESFGVVFYPAFYFIKDGRVTGMLNDLPDVKVFLEFLKNHTV